MDGEEQVERRNKDEVSREEGGDEGRVGMRGGEGEVGMRGGQG